MATKQTKKAPGVKALTKFYKLALRRIRDELNLRAQWDWPDAAGQRYEHHVRLVAMVELLEEWDCGSVGGFGVGQDGFNRHWNILERAEWLLAKYGEGK